MLGTSVGLDVLDLERASLQEIAQKVHARFVVLARRVDGGDAHHLAVPFGQRAAAVQRERLVEVNSSRVPSAGALQVP